MIFDNFETNNLRKWKENACELKGCRMGRSDKVSL